MTGRNSNWDAIDKLLEAYIPTPDPLTPGINLMPERPPITITVPKSQQIFEEQAKALTERIERGLLYKHTHPKDWIITDDGKKPTPTKTTSHCACGKDLEPKQKKCAQCRLTKQQRRSPVAAVSLTEGARWYSVADSMLWEWLDKAHAIWLADGSVWDQINGFRKDPPRDWETVRAEFGIG